MIKIRRLVPFALLAALALLLARGIANAQSATPSGQPRAIHLTSQKITLPFSNAVFAGGDPAARLANSRCLLCHSKDMIDTQPPLSLDTWKKEVDKMRTGYGCPLRADQTADLAQFIFQANSATAAAGGK